MISSIDDKRKVLDLQSLSLFLKNKSNVGLLGGSFNPAHQGHIHISRKALEKLNLDYLIWLVALQNSFKPKYQSSIFERAEGAIQFAKEDSRILISTAEYQIGRSNTYDVIKHLKHQFPNVHFTWIMGVDNISHFHTWENANLIHELCNIAIFDRPNYLTENALTQFKNQMNIYKSSSKNTIIMYLGGELCSLSSTAIREGKH